MGPLFFYSFLSFLYFGFIIVAIYFIMTWVNKFLALKQEHNQLLREILHKMEKDLNKDDLS